MQGEEGRKKKLRNPCCMPGLPLGGGVEKGELHIPLGGGGTIIFLSLTGGWREGRRGVITFVFAPLGIG